MDIATIVGLLAAFGLIFMAISVGHCFVTDRGCGLHSRGHGEMLTRGVPWGHGCDGQSLLAKD